MTRKLFDAVKIEAWREELRRPVPLSEEEVLAAPEITGLEVAALNMGVTLRMRTHEGDFIDVTLNPVVASALQTWIHRAGIEGGWLDHTGAVQAPDRPWDH